MSTTPNMKTVICPECKGRGEQLIPKLYPSGHTECWEECEVCEGKGEFAEDDYLVMKLEGLI